MTNVLEDIERELEIINAMYHSHCAELELAQEVGGYIQSGSLRINEQLKKDVSNINSYTYAVQYIEYLADFLYALMFDGKKEIALTLEELNTGWEITQHEQESEE